MGGAIAGFFAVFWLINRSYSKQMDKSRDVEIEKLNEINEKLRTEKKPLNIVLKFNQDDLSSDEEIKDLKFEKSTLKIINDKIGDKEPPRDIILAPGGEQTWFFRHYNADPEDLAILEIVDNKKRKWESKFYLYAPYQITQELRR